MNRSKQEFPEMDDAKPWYQSKTIIGGLVTVLAGVGSVLGLQVDSATTTDILLSVGSLVGGTFAIYGRIQAEQPIRRR